MYSLGIDTSNYATSLAVYDGRAGSVCIMKKKFLPVRQGTLGLRQSDAVFHHTVALPQMLSELNEEFPLSQIGCVGVSVRPRPREDSYMPCFLTGLSAAKAFCLAKDIPLVETTHQQGHIAAALYAADRQDLFEKQALLFHISGGTTDLLYCDKLTDIRLIAKSEDLYAGQAVDRLGVRLGFDFPAGVEVSRMAALCDEKVEPKISVKNGNCHLSGLENQYEKLLAEGKSPEYACKYCLTAIAKTLCAMLKEAKKQYPDLPVVCAGGVMSSDLIREYMQARYPGIAFVPGQYSSDNAAGVAVLAHREVTCG